MRRIMESLVDEPTEPALELKVALEPAPVEVAFPTCNDGQMDAEFNQSMSEIAESHGQLQGLDASMEDATAVVTALESIAEALQGIEMIPGIVTVTKIALEELYPRVGIDVTSLALALEDAKEPNEDGKKKAPEVTKNLQMNIKRIWDAIIAAIKKSMEWIRGHYNRVFGTAVMLSKRAKALEAEADKRTGEAREKTVGDAKLATVLNTKGFGGSRDQVLEVMKFIFASDMRQPEKMIAAMEKKDFKAFTQAFIELPSFASFKPISDPAAEGFDMSGDGNHEYYRSLELPGGKAIIVRSSNKIRSEKPTDIAHALRETKAYVGDFTPGKPFVTEELLPTMDLNQVKETCSSIVEIMTEVAHYQTAISKVEDVKNSLIKVTEQLAKEASGNTDPDKRAELLAMQQIGSAIPRVLDQPQAEFAAYVLRMCNAALHYVTLSLNQYEKKAAE